MGPLESRFLKLYTRSIHSADRRKWNVFCAPKWHVISGTTFSGKSTLIGLLADSGYRTVPEAARIHIGRELEVASVFMLDPLPFQPDAERVPEIEGIAAYLAEWHTRDYRTLGYKVARVPVLPPRDRLVYVLERVKEFES